MGIQLLKRKVELGLESWVLNNIYGTEEKVSVNVKALENDCIICFAEKVDVVVMPCRHLCIGIDCAQAIRQKPKSRICPICRTSKLKIENRNYEICEDKWFIKREVLFFLFI